jgi:hypothetical protein
VPLEASSPNQSVLIGVALEVDLSTFGDQALASFGATTTDDITTAFRRHTGAKTMLALAAAFGRLIGAFHDGKKVATKKWIPGFGESKIHPRNGHMPRRRNDAKKRGRKMIADRPFVKGSKKNSVTGVIGTIRKHLIPTGKGGCACYRGDLTAKFAAQMDRRFRRASFLLR